MHFLGHSVSVKALERVNEHFGGRSLNLATDFYRTSVADAQTAALAEQVTAEAAEQVLDAAREAAAKRKAANGLERRRLADEARQARIAADDAPSRRVAREQEAVVDAAERAIANLEGDDAADETEIELIQHRAWRARRYAHEARACALRVFRDALLFADAQFAANAAQSAADALKRNLERAGFRSGEI